MRMWWHSRNWNPDGHRPRNRAHVRAAAALGCQMKRTTAEDFWNKIDQSAGPDGCWPWLRSLSGDGYGHCGFLGEQLAHRVAYRLVRGKIPDEKCVLHTCDHRPCCNPKHLFLGTRLENNKDRDNKGRTARGDQHGSRTHPECRPRGEKHACAKITDAQVGEMKALYASGNWSYRSLGRRFGVSHTEVGDVINFKIRKASQ